MLNKTVIITVPRTPSTERRRWDRYHPVRKRRGSLAYHQLATSVLAASVLYSIAIVAGLGVPSLRSFSVSLSTSASVVMDLGLLFLAVMHFHFVQRPYVTPGGQRIRRSSAKCTQDRLLVTALLLGFFFVWQPLANVAWDLSAPSQLLLMRIGTYAGWISLLASAALLEIPALLRFALRVGFLSSPASASRVARAGIVCGLLLVEWCAAQMNMGHLLFAGALTAYLAITLWLYRGSVNVHQCRSSAMNIGLRQSRG